MFQLPFGPQALCWRFNPASAEKVRMLTTRVCWVGVGKKPFLQGRVAGTVVFPGLTHIRVTQKCCNRPSEDALLS